MPQKTSWKFSKFEYALWPRRRVKGRGSSRRIVEFVRIRQESTGQYLEMHEASMEVHEENSAYLEVQDIKQWVQWIKPVGAGGKLDVQEASSGYLEVFEASSRYLEAQEASSSYVEVQDRSSGNLKVEEHI